jgi:hypothetical protein
VGDVLVPGTLLTLAGSVAVIAQTTGTQTTGSGRRRSSASPPRPASTITTTGPTTNPTTDTTGVRPDAGSAPTTLPETTEVR